MKFTIFLLSIFLLSTSIQNDVELEPKYLSSELPTDVRVKDLMFRMTLEEKVAQMCQYVGLNHMRKAEKNLTKAQLDKNDAQGFYPGLHSDDIAELTKQGKIGSFLHVLDAEEANYLQELAQQSRLKIPLLIGIDAIHGNALVNGSTVYPSPITMAATWNDELVKEVSRQTAIEMRATGSHWAFTPNIDVLRDPRWGRTGETFGEDPILVGNMGVATILGLQSETISKDNVIACAKHLVAGSQSINGLNSSPTDVSERTLMEIFLPPYKRAIDEAGIFSIMLAHNELNGIPCHMEKDLMETLVRERWGFKGFYVSDWNDVSRIASWHHVAENFKEASRLSVDAGLDMHMHGPQFADHIVALVKEGSLAEERVDEACSLILTAKFDLGLFENARVDLDKIDQVVFSKQHQESALKQARQAMTLLKNDGTLPLGKGNNKSILVLGPNADNQTTLGDWASPQPDNKVITVLEGLETLGAKYDYKVNYYATGDRSKQMKDATIEEAGAKAKEADLLVLVLGENSFRHDWKNKTTGENIDRATLQLSGKQLKLVKTVHQSGKPIIVVYVSGSPIAEPWISDKVNAIINAWEPGSFGGQAIAETIFGEINPSGKLPLTIPRSVGQLQMVYNHKPTAYIHKYNTEKKVPLYPFGFGLSYTTFEYSNLKVSKETFNAEEEIFVDVNVKNTGEMAGEEVVQLYIRDKVSSVTRPVKELKGYKRVSIDPGETKVVKFTITTNDLAFYNKQMDFVVEPGEFEVMVGGSSADKHLQKISFSISKSKSN